PVAGVLGELARVGDGELVAAALGAVPEYVREEVARLVPGLAPRGGPDPGGSGGEGGGRGRLFLAGGGPVGARGAPRAGGVGWGWWLRMCTGRTVRRWIA